MYSVTLLLLHPSVFDTVLHFTAGLPDMAMSALVRVQIEGYTPEALAMIPPKKFYVSPNSVKTTKQYS